MIAPGQDTDPSKVFPQQKLVLSFTTELSSTVPCQGHSMNTSSGHGSHSQPLGYESYTLTTRPLRRPEQRGRGMFLS